MRTPVAKQPLLPFVVGAALVVVISTLAYTGNVPSAFSTGGRDKILHALMAFTLSALLARALSGRYLLAAVLVMVPLAIDEYLQRFSAARSSDWRDLAADLAGVSLAVLLGSHLARAPE